MEDKQSFGKLGVIGIRREDKSKWERRVCLTPDYVALLLKNHPHLKIVVQPSDKRIFRDNEYARAGAEISEDLSECSVIFGVKEPAIDSLLPNRTYVLFSHVIKAQSYNMALLDEILKKNIRLIDYEKITDHEGKRLVAFGHFAGNAGALDILFGLGKYFLNLGYSTPFLNMSFSFSYKNLLKAKEILEDVAETIRENGIPQDCGPLIFAISGAGRCAQGVMEILQCLPYKIVSPDEISDIVKDKENPSHRSTIYVTIIEVQHMVARIDSTKEFSKQEYYSNPELYKPIFHEKYLPHISVLFNCIYWEQKYQRLISCQQIKELADSKNLRLISIADITCDLEGSIEMLKSFTTLDEPFFLYNPSTGEYSTDMTTPSHDILYLAVENLPTELAYDATNHFSEKLHPFVDNIAMSDITLPLAEQNLQPQIKKAVIAWNGQLTEDFAYIEKLRKENEKKRQKRLLPLLKTDDKHISLKMNGHLFDSKAINQILDHLEESKINFKVLDVQMGQNNDERSSAKLQILSKDKSGLKKVFETISGIIDKYDITIED